MSHYLRKKKIEQDNPNLKQLDTSDFSALKHYEEMFYQAFIKLEKQNLIRKIWKFDDINRRIKTKISYRDQVILNICEKDNILGAIALNVAEREFQYSEYGFHFSTQPNEDIHICEVLTVFSVKNRINWKEWIRLCQVLADHGFTDILATTAPGPMPLYKRFFKFEVIDSNVVDGETRYFIHINLEKILKKEKFKNDDD